MGLLKAGARKGLQLWAKTGVAPGILHGYVDAYATSLYPNTRLFRKIQGGAQLSCDIRDHVQSRIYFLGAYEPIEAYLCHQLISPDSQVIDAGGNVGFYSLLLGAKVKGKGQVYSFEPVEKNNQVLLSNIAGSGLEDTVQVIKKGLWSESTTLTFALAEEHSQNLGSFTVGAAKDKTEEFHCPTTTLDEFANQNLKTLDFIKMDIEGAELEALKGGQATLEAYRPNMLIEINEEACRRCGYETQELFGLLSPLGYKMFRVSATPDQSGFVTTFKGMKQENVLFLNEQSAKTNLHWDYKVVKKFFAQA